MLNFQRVGVQVSRGSCRRVNSHSIASNVNNDPTAVIHVNSRSIEVIGLDIEYVDKWYGHVTGWRGALVDRASD